MLTLAFVAALLTGSQSMAEKLNVDGGKPAEKVSEKSASGEITIRTESFARPPYSGATYYIYERDGRVICTKLETCNKFDDCDAEYRKGSYLEDEDKDSKPADHHSPVTITKQKLKIDKCLTKFKLI